MDGFQVGILFNFNFISENILEKKLLDPMLFQLQI